MKKRNPAHTYADEVPTYAVLLAMLTNTVAKLNAAEHRLARVATLHGVIDGLCDQCGELTCPTRVALTEYVSGVNAAVNWDDKS